MVETDATSSPVARESVPRPRLPDRRTHLIEELRFRLTDPRVGAVALGLVAVAAGVAWYLAGLRSDGAAPRADESVTNPADDVTDAVETTADDGPAVLTVHVAGAVAEPGVVELVAGSRVIDALEAVGGALAEGDLDQLNLAAALTDGQRVLVPRAGETLPAEDAAPGDVVADGGLLDLNTATKAQLEELPGIGPVLADAIVTDRDERGGYRAVEDLRGVSGIGEKRFADIKDLVTVG